jgi:pectate lyase
LKYKSNANSLNFQVEYQFTPSLISIFPPFLPKKLINIAQNLYINITEMKNTVLTFAFFLYFLTFSNANAQVVLIENTGWLESAYVKWSPVADATNYKVYVKAADAQEIDYKLLDDMLVRRYADYFRADALGLKAGNYQLKVVPVFDGQENTTQATVSEPLNVKAYIREGFAFSTNSPNQTSSGAYNDDGTLREGAQIIYLTAANAQTVQLDVVTNNKGGVTACTGIGEILAARQKGYDLTPLAIRVIGKVTAANMAGQINSLSLIEVKGKSSHTEMNITVEGVGDDATTFGWGILVRNSVNVEVRNMGFMQFPDDGVSLDTDNRNIWIHNNDFFYGKNGGGDKNKGDGSLDSKKTGYTTLSFNHFWDSGKCNLLGNGTEDPEYLTYHHNWYDHSDSRHPRVRFHSVHVYNNYYDGNSKYGIGAANGGPSIFAENNYFRHCKYPMLISMQGSDVWNASKGANDYSNNPTFSKEDGGIIKAYGNYIEQASRFIPYNAAGSGTPNPAVDFDAVVVSSRDETIPSSVKTVYGNYTYNNFDTNASIMYPYTIQSPEEAKADVMQYAGRVNGGDLKFTFDASEDTNAEIIPALENAVKNYTSSVLAIGGTDVSGGGDNGGGGAVTGSLICHFTGKQVSNAAFSVTGNFSDSKGSVSVGGVTYSDCLKMESATSVRFTISEPMTLTLIFATTEGGKKVKIDGTNYTTDAQGIATVTLEAGEHEITKGDSINLFYISLQGSNASGWESVSPKGNVVETTYYNIAGVCTNKLQLHSIYIREEVYENGSVKRTKLIYKK